MFLWVMLSPILLTSCAQMAIKDRNYRATRDVEVNGAQVRSALKPIGGNSGFALSAMFYSAGVGSTDGPYRWRVEADGKAGVHEWLRVNQVQVTTSKTKRNEWYPTSQLGVKSPFEEVPGEEGVTFAKSQFAGKLTVMPKVDGDIKVRVNVSVQAQGRVQSKWLEFEMAQETKWRTESMFVPVEIVKSFGKKKDPREWAWGSSWPQE